MLSKIKALLSKVLSISAAIARFSVRAALALIVGATMAAVVGGMGVLIDRRAEEASDRQSTYTLQLFGEFMGRMIPLDRLQITDVRHMQDGSLCYEDVGSGRQGCIKAQHYFLQKTDAN